ncbi:MAG: hypothetical protein JNM76_07365 [Betaproteobacteria bacterium]|nr:hypothetical protein [Betaproteobacteria bacterium]
MKSLSRIASTLIVVACLAGCATVAGGTNMLTDERIVAESAGALGLAPSDLALLSRRTAGTNTYATLRGKDKAEYACVINGGNLLSFGMVNPPTCSRR